MPESLTSRQQQVLNAIVAYDRRYGFPPTIRELQKELNLSSPRSVAFHLENLERKGWIERDSTPRGIRVLVTGVEPASDEAIYLPLVGNIAAGNPLLADENIQEWIPVPTTLVGEHHNAFLLEVRGDSMVQAHILDSDLVIVDPQPVASNGDIVVVLINDEATIKRFYQRNDKMLLKPANPAYEPIEVTDDIRIQGKVIGVLRSSVSASSQS